MLNILSLGAGVQSSTMAIMGAQGLLLSESMEPIRIDAAIFADTQAEPASVYEWIEYLKTVIPMQRFHFPIHVVSAGNIIEDELRVRTSRNSGKTYLNSAVPYFVKRPEDSRVGMLRRRCTADFKIIPIQRKVKELLRITRMPSGSPIMARMLIGISTDEASRMKPSHVSYLENTYPLITLGMSRRDCLNWMEKNKFPPPPRTACIFCPYRNNNDWRTLKETDPESFKKAVEFEEQLQISHKNQVTLESVPFLHRSLVKIGDIDFAPLSKELQLNLFENECEGMCGV